MKFKVGGLTPEEDAERFRHARAAAGPDFVLCADANQGWTPAEAVRFARLVEDLDLHWFEEPCRWSNDRRAMRDVRFAAGVPRLRRAERVLGRRVPRSDGRGRDRLLQLRLARGRAARPSGAASPPPPSPFDVAMAHHEEPQIASHLLASIPHGTFLECFSADRDPIWWNLVANRPPIVDGRMTLPDRPGLGWELDGGLHRAYRVPPRP